MANISLLSRLVNGVQRHVDLSANTLVVSDLQINGINLRSALVGVEGSRGIGDFNDYSNFTPAAATIKGALTGIDAALAAAGGTSFSDATFRVYDDGDPSKLIALQASGISTATTRTITMPDANVNLGEVNTSIQQNGSRAFTANQSMGSFKLTNMADPTLAQDAATKSYIDSLLDGRSWKQPARAASTANIDLAVAADPSPVDGVTLANGDRILLKNQTAPAENGIYIATTAADPTTWVRSSDANTALELISAAVFVSEGTVNHDFQFAQTADSITLGVTAIVWVITSANSFSGHDMISIVGGQISVDLATASGLESTNPGNAAGQLRIKLEASNPSLKFSGSNELGAKLDPAGAIVSGASGLVAQTDGVSLETSANAHRIKTTAYDQSSIVGGSGTAASVATSPKNSTTLVAGEAFAANTTFAVRWAVSGETAGRVYKADQDSTTSDKFWVIGIGFSVAGVSAGGNLTVVMLGSHTLLAGDSSFSAGDIGKPVFLTAAGAFSITAPTTSLYANFKIGTIQSTTQFWIDRQMMGVY